MVTPTEGAAMTGPMYSLRGNGAQHGGHGFQFGLSTFQGSRLSFQQMLVSDSVLIYSMTRSMTSYLNTVN